LCSPAAASGHSHVHSVPGGRRADESEKSFVIYTFAGSLPWCLGLAYVGQKLGEKWDKDPMLKTLFHRFDS